MNEHEMSAALTRTEATQRATWKLAQRRAQRIFDLQGDLGRLREERDALQAKLAAVRALVDRLAHDSSLTDSTRRDDMLADARDDERVDIVLALRAILDGDTPAPECPPGQCAAINVFREGS